MLEKPDLQDQEIIACLRDEYRLDAVQVAFLPLGVDRNAAVYRVVADDGKVYFLKLRRGAFDDIAVALPKYLSDQGIDHIIAPLPTRKDRLWASLDPFKLILYPFVEGRDGYEVGLSDDQWVELGAALKSIHTAAVDPALINRIPRETYSAQWRESAKMFLERAECEVFDDPVSGRLADFLRARREEIVDLVGRAGGLAQDLLGKPKEFVLCHSDIHAGNILVGAGGGFYIVDWDEPVLAPKERDLMFIGGGLMGGWRTPQEEEALFYRDYGHTEIDPMALAYYRYERVVQDIAVFCEQILLTNEGGQDREQSLRYLTSSFEPNGVLEVAYVSDRTQYPRRRVNPGS